jgi:SOS-response transcriptional repressor LexA
LNRDGALLRFIVEYQDANGGISPTYDEIAAALGLASKSGVHRLLVHAERIGMLRRLPGHSRAIEVSAQAKAVLFPNSHRVVAGRGVRARRFGAEEDVLRAVGWRLSQAAPLTRIE